MFIRQAELFEGVSANAKRTIEAQGMERSYKAGEVVFKEGDESEYFYMLEEGKVDLYVGKQEEMRFLVHYPGEIFGWSALVKPHRYLASARCEVESTITKVPRSVIDIISKDYPSDGQLIYKHLAGILAERLIEAYRENLPQSGRQTPSYG
jgi:CRP-like cAMP-binding protein